MGPLLLALALAACGEGGADDPPAGSPVPGPDGRVEFRALLEHQSATFCVQGPEFAVARTRQEWASIAERQWGCQPLADPAEMIVDWEAEVGVAAWWKVEGCLGYSIRTRAIEREGGTVTVTATSSGPGEGMACATALGGLESFYAISRAGLVGASSIRFVLDGAQVGSVAIDL